MSTTYPLTPSIFKGGFSRKANAVTNNVLTAARGTPSVKGETAPVSSGLLSLHTTQTEASKNLEKKRKFSEVEGTQGQVILG